MKVRAPSACEDPGQAGLARWLLAVALLFGAASIAFWPSYLGQPSQASSALVHLHAALAVSWMAWLALQAALAHSRRLTAHRRLGRLAPVAALVFLAVAVALAHQNALALRLGPDAYRAWLLVMQLNTCALWALAFGAGWWWRGQPREHPRAMAGTLVVMLDPVVARLAWPLLPVPALPYAGPVAVWLVLLTLIWRDHHHGVCARAWPLLLAASMPGPLLAPTVAGTAPWLEVAQAFARIGAAP